MANVSYVLGVDTWGVEVVFEMGKADDYKQKKVISYDCRGETRLFCRVTPTPQLINPKALPQKCHPNA